MKKLLGIIGILTLAAGLLPASGYADYRGSFAPLATPGSTGIINGCEQPAWRKVDAGGVMLLPVDNSLIEEWFTFTSRGLIPGREQVRSIYEHWDAQQSGYFFPLLSDPASDISYFDPSWSSDGRFLAYVQNNRDGTGQAIYVQEYFVNDDFEVRHGGSYPDGQGAESPVGSPILVTTLGNARHPDWSPTGHSLAFDSDAAGTADIYTVDVDVVGGTAGTPIRRTFNSAKAETNPAWAPNGHEIAYVTNKFGQKVVEILDLNLSSGDPAYLHLAERNFGQVSHNNPSYAPDGGTLYYDAPSGEDPSGLTTIWKIDLTTQGKCEINLDQTLADSDPNVSGVAVHTKDNIPFNYFAFVSQAGGLGLATWRGNPINMCQLPLEMGVATIPATMNLNDQTTTTFQTVMNFPPETRDVGYACYFPNGSGVNYRTTLAHPHAFAAPPGKDSIKPRNSIVPCPTLLGLRAPAIQVFPNGSGGAPFPDCYDSVNTGLVDSLRLVCNWDFRTIADRLVALGLTGSIVPMKMTAYSTGAGRGFQGFAYMRLTSGPLLAGSVALLGNSPNPFNPVTKIRFAVSKPGTYTLRLYDVQGALIKTVANGIYGVGTHEATWDGRTNSGGKAASGVYYAKISGAGKAEASQLKLVMAK